MDHWQKGIQLSDHPRSICRPLISANQALTKALLLQYLGRAVPHLPVPPVSPMATHPVLQTILIPQMNSTLDTMIRQVLHSIRPAALVETPRSVQVTATLSHIPTQVLPSTKKRNMKNNLKIYTDLPPSLRKPPFRETQHEPRTLQ